MLGDGPGPGYGEVRECGQRKGFVSLSFWGQF